MSWPHVFQHWLAVHTGTVNEPGPYYGFWSGFGGILERLVELSVIAAILLRRHNCEVRGCWRIGRHDTAAGHNVCRQHHPDGHLTAATVVTQHHRALERDRSNHD
jgi:hypothetical protein